jgi:type IV secretion system protein VirB11
MTDKQESQRRTLATLEFTMGQDILHYLQQENVFELMVNPDGKLWIDTFDKGRLNTNVIINPTISQQIIYQVAALSDQVCTEKTPMLSAELPDGSRFQGFLPKVVMAPAFNIRKHSKRVFTLDDYVQNGVMSVNQRLAIVQAIHAKKNIIAAGGTKSGKTTLLNAILAEISKSDDRIVMIEDLPELKCSAANYLSLRTTDCVSMDELLRNTLRATPDRIVVGEVRSGEALALLDAWSTGHNGGASTIHANSAQHTLLRLQQLVSRVSINPQQATIGEAVDVVVYLKLKGTTRYIEEVLAVEKYDELKKIYITKKIA